MKAATKPKPVQGKNGRFLTGNSGGGRPVGSRNKLSEAFLDALCGDFEQHGAEVIGRVRESEPGAYLRVIASLMPKRLETHPIDCAQMSDAELMEVIQRDAAELTALSDVELGKAKH